MGTNAFYGTTYETESLATIDRALQLGITLLDTAESYGPFINKQLVSTTRRPGTGQSHTIHPATRPATATSAHPVRPS
ncbi:aldo/keto reductase [Kitasatospora purpeofusca]|uniref:aldo/keto reductase n=1 Tax=Kitasatospora purpeofusca TaxID=67352 RepID=UPI0036740910